MGRAALRLFVFLCVLGAIGATVFLTWGYTQFVQPGPLVSPTAVVIPKGIGIHGIAQRLQDAGVVRNATIFRYGVRFLGRKAPLRAGEFEFPAAISPRQAMEVLQQGPTVVRRLTVAEGLTSAEVVDLIAGAEGLSGAVGKVPAEGALLPETYHFSFGDPRQQVIARMRQSMAETVDALWAERTPGLPLKTKRDAVILASIVEKETAKTEERPRIAAVFVNRLRKGMKLQSDPTVAYGLARSGGGLGRPLTRADLKTPTPFNTYTIDGLPPAPICNPGRDAIAAVLRPSQTEELFFVADGTGGHLFAKTLDEHNRNVAHWRRIQRQRKSGNAPQAN
ncbi:MAG: endolytic transglycosylase MltG [Hyphomicrobiales bacterium]|nr:endolytic transglycosylase MltG [Hyphomicrobiales bacterium]MCP5373852.1 endolytic transglycosylase MltG [Hyphomicrobiales bacterium]